MSVKVVHIRFKIWFYKNCSTVAILFVVHMNYQKTAASLSKFKDHYCKFFRPFLNKIHQNVKKNYNAINVKLI